ncbi:MAG: DNA replication/repair protein RecF [Lachnospiraceae bacterium]|nr:DNA replication/repair protein RecF [Lachnospiraceae bacterium]
MEINSVEVGSFRNYNSAKLEFHSHTNILYGDNAQGKTNILEAVFVCGTTKSHKGCKDKELIKLGYDEAHIRMFIEKKQIQHKIDIHLRQNKAKGIAIDGIPIKRSSELLGLVNIIFFSPEDLKIVKNGPSERRRFINLELSQLDKVYLYELGEYNKALMQRNKLLKQISFKPSLCSTLDIWDEKLAEFGSKVIIAREKFIEKLSIITKKINEKLTGGREHIELLYEPDVEAGTFISVLRKAREKDLHFLSTSAGPHKDDLCFINNGVDIRKYGSQGQQRTCALSLKLAEIELVKELTNDTPVLLLDDVLSELDRNRQNYLLDSINNIQTIITCTGLEEFIDSRLSLDKVFRIIDGTVILEK